jgi:acetate---CoA ligase (ADP-forming)
MIQKKADKIIQGYLKEGKITLGRIDENEILKCYGFNTLKMELAKTKTQAIEIAEKIGFSVVMKIVSSQILHKTDAGVVVRVKDTSDMGSAFEQIMDNTRNYDSDADIEGVLVQEMSPKGKEVILGVINDPGFVMP